MLERGWPQVVVVALTGTAAYLVYRRAQRRAAAAASEPRSTSGTQHGDPRFFADKDGSGLLRVNPRLIDTFLRWECGRTLLSMNLFPNVQEITESMACLAALTEHLGDQVASEDDVVAVVIGDGRSPRTAARCSARAVVAGTGRPPGAAPRAAARGACFEGGVGRLEGKIEGGGGSRAKL